jgi:hypothetical protein
MSSTFLIRRGALTAVSLVLTLLARPSPAQVTSTGIVNKFNAVVADDLQCRIQSNNLFADVPDLSKIFTLAGATDEQVAVIFTASWPEPTSGTPAGAFVRLVIDGLAQDLTSANGGVLVHDGSPTDLSYGARAFTFVSNALDPGPHTAKIQWSDNFLVGTGTICIRERSLVVLHK